jgi:hypothetical protein
VLAIFGLNSDPSTACRQALRAVPLVAARIDELNAVLQQQLQIRIRFGIGLHCGRAVVGQIGFSEHVTFTAIGDPLNVASRLEQLTKEMACEAIVSDQVFHHAGVSASSLPHVAARLRGRDEPVPVRILSLAAQMPMPPAQPLIGRASARPPACRATPLQGLAVRAIGVRIALIRDLRALRIDVEFACSRAVSVRIARPGCMGCGIDSGHVDSTVRCVGQGRRCY